MTNKPVSKLAFNAQDARVCIALCRFDSYNFSVLDQKIHLATYPAVRASGTGFRNFPGPKRFAGFCCQGAGGTDRNAVAARDTIAIFKKCVKGYCHRSADTPILEGKSAVTLDFIADPN